METNSCPLVVYCPSFVAAARLGDKHYDKVTAAGGKLLFKDYDLILAMSHAKRHRKPLTVITADCGEGLRKGWGNEFKQVSWWAKQRCPPDFTINVVEVTTALDLRAAIDQAVRSLA